MEENAYIANEKNDTYANETVINLRLGFFESFGDFSEFIMKLFEYELTALFHCINQRICTFSLNG